jgi:hypothetical protein
MRNSDTDTGTEELAHPEKDIKAEYCNDPENDIAGIVMSMFSDSGVADLDKTEMLIFMSFLSIFWSENPVKLIENNAEIWYDGVGII